MTEDVKRPDVSESSALRGFGVGVLVLAGLLALLLAGCDTAKKHEASYRFGKATRSYANAIRWSDYQSARSMLRARDGSLMKSGGTMLDEVRVVSVDMTDQRVSLDMKEAMVTARFDFYHTESATVHSMSVEQLWWFDEDQNRWFLEGELPDFQAGMRRGRKGFTPTAPGPATGSGLGTAPVGGMGR